MKILMIQRKPWWDIFHIDQWIVTVRLDNGKICKVRVFKDIEKLDRMTTIEIDNFRNYVKKKVMFNDQFYDSHKEDHDKLKLYALEGSIIEEALT